MNVYTCNYYWVDSVTACSPTQRTAKAAEAIGELGAIIRDLAHLEDT